MRVEFKVIDLPKVAKFIENLSLKGMQSINRSRLLRKMNEELEIIIEGEKSILKDFKDDDEKRSEELKEYYESTVVISGEEFIKPLQTIKNKVKEYTKDDSTREFSGEEAHVLAVLYDALNVGGEEE